MRKSLVFSSLLATFLYASGAFAQNKAAIAESLYNEGKQALEAGRISEACKKFAESQRVDPATGTLFALATCHEKEGKTASAWGEFIEVADLYKKAGKTEREGQARDGAARLEKQLIRLTLTMNDRPKGLEIKLDGNSLSEGILGNAVPVDPGDHTLQITAPGKKPAEQTFKVDKTAANTKVEIAPLVDAPAETPTNGGPKVVVERVPAEDPGAVRRTIGWLTLGTGVALGGVALTLQLTAVNSKKSDAVAEKTNKDANLVLGDSPALQSLDRCAEARQLAAGKTDQLARLEKMCGPYESAKSLQTMNIILGITGGVAAITGIVLVVTSFGGSKPEPKSDRNAGIKVTPVIGYGHAGLVGTF